MAALSLIVLMAASEIMSEASLAGVEKAIHCFYSSASTPLLFLQSPLRGLAALIQHTRILTMQRITVEPLGKCI